MCELYDRKIVYCDLHERQLLPLRSGKEIERTLWISRTRHERFGDEHEDYSGSPLFSMRLKPSLLKWVTTRPPPIRLLKRPGFRQARCINSSLTKKRLHRPWRLGTSRNSSVCIARCFRSRPQRFLSQSGSIRSLTP